MPSSSIAFPGGPGPAAGFDQPFEMLGACHDRVRRSLQLLQRLVEHSSAHGSDRAAQEAARDVLRYFRVAAPHHHEDEERHVVPVLLASGDEKLQAIARRLLQDHEAIRLAWAELDPLLDRVRQGQAVPAALASSAQRFVDVHRDHLLLEDGVAFVQAAGRVDEERLKRMGEEMAARRGVR